MPFASEFRRLPILTLAALLAAGCQLTPVARAPVGGLTDEDGGDDAGAVLTPSGVGGPCAGDSDCVAGTCLTDLPDGYCTQDCSRSNPCPEGSRCVQTSQTRTQCLVDCTDSSECREGYLCAQGFCLPKCTIDSDCSNNRVCDTSSGRCVAPTGCRSNADCGANQTCNTSTGQCTGTSTAGRIGAACTSNGNCTEGAQPLCFPAQIGFPGGYCSSTCSANSPCPNGNYCVEFESDQGGVAYCLDACNADSDCRSQYYCSLLNTGKTACLPYCRTDNECDTGLTCNRSTGRCGWPTTGTDGGTPTPDAGTPDAGPIVIVDGGYAGTTTRTSLGTINGGRPASVSVTVPADAVSSFFVATPAAGQATSGFTVGLGWLKDPGQNVLYSVYASGNWPLRTYPNENGSAGVLFPNAPPPGLNYTPGTYTAQFYSYQTAVNLDVTHILKTATGPLTGGTIDVNLWFDNSVMTAAQAKAGMNFNSMLNTIKTIWASVGVQMGNVTFNDLSDPTRAFRNLTDEELGLACRATTPTNDGVNLVFIDSISNGGSGGTVLGVAAGIPGTPMRGTSASCVAVAMSSWRGSTTNTTFATTIVHETGHWLGLFHTTEATGADFDPLPDTLQCPVGTYDRNGDRTVSDIECANRDGRNVMFWLSDSTGLYPHTTFTANQQFVMLRNPAIY